MRGALIVAACGLWGATAYADADRRVLESGKGSVGKRVRAARALGESPRQSAYEALATAMRSDRSTKVREAAARSLLAQAKSRPKLERAVRAHFEKCIKREKNKRLRRVFARLLQKAIPVTVRVFLRPTQAKQRMVKPRTRDAIDRSLASTLRSAGGLDVKSLRANAETPGTDGEKVYLVASRVSQVWLEESATGRVVHCSLDMRVAPTRIGKQGGQKLAKSKTASLSGTGLVQVRGNNNLVRAKRDCLLGVAEEVASEQLAPFLRSQAE